MCKRVRTWARVCIYTHTHQESYTVCFLWVFHFVLFCLWRGGKGLREFVAKEGKFRDSFHFKVEM